MLYDLLSLIFSAFLGGLISLGLYRLSERKERDKKRLHEFQELLIKTKEIAFEATDLLNETKELNKESITRCRCFTGHIIPEYTLSVLSHAIYIDEEVYNDTVDFIDFLRNQSEKLGYGKTPPANFIKIVNSLLDNVSKKCYGLLNIFEDRYQEYLREFGNRYMK